jgi:hypothetical protein
MARAYRYVAALGLLTVGLAAAANKRSQYALDAALDAD